jgi:hypothetical protein
LADGDPAKIRSFEEMPLIEYWYLLNLKLAEIEKADKAAQKAKVKRNARNIR